MMGGLRRSSSGGTRTPKPGSGGSGGFGGNEDGGTSTVNNPRPRAGTEYENDNVQRMPVLDSVSAVRAAQRLARQLSGRSGRTSTRLVSTTGTQPYVASLLGSTL